MGLHHAICILSDFLIHFHLKYSNFPQLLSFKNNIAPSFLPIVSLFVSEKTGQNIELAPFIKQPIQKKFKLHCSHKL